MPRFHVQRSCLTILVTLSVPVAAQVQTTPPTPRRAFVVTDANHIYQVNFDTGTAAGPVNPNDGGRTALRDLVVRDLDLANRPDLIDLLLFDQVSATDADILRYVRDPGGEWFGTSVLQGPFAQPNGLSLGLGGALYFVDNPPPLPSPSRVWVLPPDRSELPQGDGFAASAVPIDDNPPCSVMVDTAVVKFQGPGLSLGDLLVLCQEPPLVLRYAKGLPCQDTSACTLLERRPLFGLPSTETPTSLLFTPAGNLLIASFDDSNVGRILRFFIDDGRLDVAAFVGGLPPGDARMVGGIQERPDGTLGSFLLYANQAAQSVSRYVPLAGGGVLDPDPATPNPVPLNDEGPVGVGVGTSRAAPTRAGDGSRTQPRESLLATFDRVLTAGLTESRLFVFKDPRPFLSTTDPLYLCDPGLEYLDFACRAAQGDYFVDLGLPNVIPPEVKPLQVKPAPTLTPVTAKGVILPPEHKPFILFELSSTAGFQDMVKLQALEDLLLGPDIYGCQEAAEMGIVSLLPLFFHGADLDDAPVVEGFEFFPVPSGCGSNFGRTFAFSSFLVGRLNVSGPFAAALPAVQHLRTALDPATPPGMGGLRSFIAPGLGDVLLELTDAARTAILGSDGPGAIGLLESFLKAVRDNRGLIDDSTRNVSAEMQVRATAPIFLLCGGTNCSDAVDTHAEDVGLIFVDGFESGDPTAWTASTP